MLRITGLVMALIFSLSVPVAAAQVYPEPSGWIRSGNCWFSENGFLYCGERHPYDEDNPGPFLSFVCFKHYQAVLFFHPDSPMDSDVRTVNSDFGDLSYSDIWIATDPKESFMSNNVSAPNEGYFNLLKGFSNPDSKHFKFLIDPGGVEGSIALTGEEFQVVNAYADLCSGKTL